MNHLAFLQAGGAISWGLFIFAFGACCGSLINVLVYRLPHGLNVVSAPSRCPQCGTKLTWRENIPVLGWLALRGRCRFCRSAISPEYPMVEAFVGLLFVTVFALWYLIPTGATWLDIPWGSARPDWALNDAFDGFPRKTWPALTAVLMLFASLAAMTLVDAKTFTIPLQLPWFATLVGIVFHTLGSIVIGPFREHAPLSHWAIPQPGGAHPESPLGWWWIGATIGATIGLGVAMALLHFGLIRRSFADYHEWEAKALGQAQPATTALSSTPVVVIENAATQPDLHTAGPVGENAGAGAWIALRFILVFVIFTLLSICAGWILSRTVTIPAWSGLVFGIAIGPLVAAAAVRSRVRTRALARTAIGVATSAGLSDSPPAAPPPDPNSSANPTDLWIQYPHARREMVKELLFLTPCIALGWLGATLVAKLGSSATPVVPPFWLVVLTASLMGYLIGGGLVWFVRIIASLAFGKEAIGLGDVHLMGAVGACVGWIDASLAFPLAAAVGLYCTVVTWIMTGTIGRALPFGPHLAVATVLVVLGKPLVELGLSRLLSAPINLP